MKWSEWQPRYEAILRDFGFPREDDEAARDELAALLLDHPGLVEPEAAFARLRGRDVLVVGAGPDFRRLAEPPEGWAIVVADKALERAMRSHLFPDVLVTDLDGDLALAAEANRRGTVVVVHAHGDNRARLPRWLASLPGPLLGTCQCEPVGLVPDFGGFTDGDRACFLASEAGARAVHLEGFDFEHVGRHAGDPDVKRRKLRWAERLIADVPIPVYRGGVPFTQSSTQA